MADFEKNLCNRFRCNNKKIFKKNDQQQPYL